MCLMSYPFLVFSELRLELIVRSVDIGGTVYHQFKLSFLNSEETNQLVVNYYYSMDTML